MRPVPLLTPLEVTLVRLPYQGLILENPDSLYWPHRLLSRCITLDPRLGRLHSRLDSKSQELMVLAAMYLMRWTMFFLLGDRAWETKARKEQSVVMVDIIEQQVDDMFEKKLLPNEDFRRFLVREPRRQLVTVSPGASSACVCAPQSVPRDKDGKR